MTFETSADNETALHQRYAISYSCVRSSIRLHVITGLVEFYSDSWIISFSHHFGPRSLRLFWLRSMGPAPEVYTRLSGTSQAPQSKGRDV
jgi:hypothetical protein